MTHFLLLLLLCINAINGCHYMDSCERCVPTCYFVTLTSGEHICVNDLDIVQDIAAYVAKGSSAAWCPSVPVPPPPPSSSSPLQSTTVVPTTTPAAEAESSALVIIIVVVIIIIIIIIIIIALCFMKKRPSAFPDVDAEKQNEMNDASL